MDNFESYINEFTNEEIENGIKELLYIRKKLILEGFSEYDIIESHIGVSVVALNYILKDREVQRKKRLIEKAINNQGYKLGRWHKVLDGISELALHRIIKRIETNVNLEVGIKVNNKDYFVYYEINDFDYFDFIVETREEHEELFREFKVNDKYNFKDNDYI